MNIARIQTTPLALEFKEPYHWAGRVDYAAGVVLVEVETDDGLLGIGATQADAERQPAPCSVRVRPTG